MERLKLRTSQKIYLPFKRLIGILGSLIGIVLCAGLIWWWVLIVNAIVTKGHPFFIRHRIGKNSKPFKILKFRSMKLEANPHMSSKDIEAQRNVTGFGKFLRATSIDETPQLLNIFIGQMAFIGPRPLIDASYDSITIEKRKENGADAIKPGISGYAQIHKRAELDPVRKAEFDLIYMEKMSFWFDVKIFCYTLLKLFGAAKGK